MRLGLYSNHSPPRRLRQAKDHSLGVVYQRLKAMQERRAEAEKLDLRRRHNAWVSKQKSLEAGKGRSLAGKGTDHKAMKNRERGKLRESYLVLDRQVALYLDQLKEDHKRQLKEFVESQELTPEDIFDFDEEKWSKGPDSDDEAEHQSTAATRENDKEEFRVFFALSLLRRVLQKWHNSSERETVDFRT